MMRSFFACLKKDMMLFFAHKTSAILTLVLPLAVFFVMQYGMAETVSKRNYVESFKIAVVDEDRTLMSKTLTEQLKNISLFSEVYETDFAEDSLFEDDFAGVITIPKDFFYAAYDMENIPIGLVLNSQMPVESEILYSLVSSVSDILAADQRAVLAEYLLQYGELGEEHKSALYEEASLQVIRDALNRQEIFSIAEQGAEEERLIKLSIYSCSLTLLIMLVCLQVVKTVPEEMEMGIAERFIAAGGKSSSLVLSKFTAAVLLLLPVVLVLNFAFGFANDLSLLLLVFVSVVISFSIYLFFAVICRNTAKVQMLSNAFLIVSLIAGGAIYPVQLLPAYIRPLSSLTVPFLVNTSLQLYYFEADFPSAMKPFFVPLVFSFVLMVVSFVLYKKGRRGSV
ncbi:MAG: ABC transporter permease [Christensenellaceae bacterium]|nr:ABC transporter permease [Christensenellaceae bacterium]